MNIEVLDREKDTFGVGFAFVEEEYREKGIWSTMSKEAEKEAKRSGAKLFRRDIRDDNEFLVEFLTSKDKYKEIKGSSSLEKRL